MLSAVRFPRGRVRLSDFRRRTRIVGPILRASPSPFLWKGPDVTCFAVASYAANGVEAGDFSTPLRCGRNNMKGRSAARVQIVQRVQRFKGWWWRLRRSIQAPSRRRSLTLHFFAAASYAVGCVEAGDFGAPLSTLEMTGSGAFRMKMTKRSVNGKILFPKLWKMKSFGNRIFT